MSQKNTHTDLPRTARDVFRLRPLERLLYGFITTVMRLSGWWRYPARRSGDLETMTFMDKVYWLYKTTSPVRHARRRSGIEEMFIARKRHGSLLPEGFSVEHELTLSAVGDLMNHPYLARSRDVLYAQVADQIFGTDISMANLECVVYPEGSGELSFSPRHGPPLYYRADEFDVVKGYGARKYSFMATACNHSLDFGTRGVAATIDALRREGIAFNGLNEDDADATRATIIERSSIRVGIISHTFGLNAYQPPRDRPRIVNRSRLNSGVNDVDLSQIASQIAWCHQQAVDFIVGQLHWGMEHELFPTPEQRGVGHLLAEMGIDLIVGHHPHVVQPVEFHTTRRDPDRIVPIYYSLGNLVNPFSAPYLCASDVAQISIAKGRMADGTAGTLVKQAGRLPVIQQADSETRTIRLLPVRGHEPEPYSPSDGSNASSSRG